MKDSLRARPSRRAARKASPGRHRTSEGSPIAENAPKLGRRSLLPWLLAAIAAFIPLAFHRMKMQGLWWHLAAGSVAAEETGSKWLNQIASDDS